MSKDFRGAIIFKQIGLVVWEEFYHIHTYIHIYTHTYTRNLANVALSIRVTLNAKPASQVLINKFAQTPLPYLQL